MAAIASRGSGAGPCDSELREQFVGFLQQLFVIALFGQLRMAGVVREVVDAAQEEPLVPVVNRARQLGSANCPSR